MGWLSSIFSWVHLICFYYMAALFLSRVAISAVVDTPKCDCYVSLLYAQGNSDDMPASKTYLCGMLAIIIVTCVSLEPVQSISCWYCNEDGDDCKVASDPTEMKGFAIDCPNRSCIVFQPTADPGEPRSSYCSDIMPVYCFKATWIANVHSFYGMTRQQVYECLLPFTLYVVHLPHLLRHVCRLWGNVLWLNGAR